MTYKNGFPSSDSVNLGSNPSSPATRNADVSGVSSVSGSVDKPELSEQKRTAGHTEAGTAPRHPANKGKGRGIAFLRAHLGFDGDDCLIWPMSFDDHGYPLVAFNGRNYKAGALMCELVHGPKPSPKHHAAHSCGKGQIGCVHPKHVRWATPKENMQDSVRLGACDWKGRRPARILLTEEDVAKILAMRGKATYREIGPMFGVKPKQIGKIFRGEQWKGGKLGRVGGMPRAQRNTSAN